MRIPTPTKIVLTEFSSPFQHILPGLLIWIYFSHMSSEVWDEITYPFAKISAMQPLDSSQMWFLRHFIMDVITY